MILMLLFNVKKLYNAALSCLHLINDIWMWITAQPLFHMKFMCADVERRQDKKKKEHNIYFYILKILL